MSRKPDSLSGIKVRKEGRNKDCDLWARLVLRFFPSRIWASTSTQLLEPGDAAVRRPFSREKKGACCKAPGPAGISTSFALLFSPPRPRSLVRVRQKKKKKKRRNAWGGTGQKVGKWWPGPMAISVERRRLCRWRWGWMKFVEAFRCRVLEIIVAAVRTAQGVDGWWTGCLRSVAKM